jgi:O-antigen/teichoic acid export membrane protein
MNKYKKLAVNTLIFSLGSFGAKIFSFLLNNLYTKHLSPSGLYTKSLLETLVLFLLPVFTFSLTEAVVRYGLDNEYDQKQVFTTAGIITFCGLALMLPVTPFLHLIPVLEPIKSYSVLLYIYVFASALRALCSQFVRARNMVKLFSLDGILATVSLFVFNIIFISKLGMGIKGFMLSIILSDTCSAIFLFISAKLREFADIKSFDRSLGKTMLRFTLPLVPTTIMWTFTGFSDQIFIGNMHSDKVFLGKNAAGIYVAATKIPNLISMLSTIFMQAWNMSAIMENKSADRDKFYEKVYSAYESLLFISSAGLILLIKPVSAILINYANYPEYKTAYSYTPLLIVAAVFTCLNLFLAGIYTATTHTKNAFYTIFVVAAANIFLNLGLIPIFGIQGAALATFLSYLLCYIIRMFDARRYVPFNFSVVKTAVNTFLLLLMSIPIIFSLDKWILYEIPIATVIVFINNKAVFDTIRKLLDKETEITTDTQ